MFFCFLEVQRYEEMGRVLKFVIGNPGFATASPWQEQADRRTKNKISHGFIDNQ
jgi:hypothetical protein